MILHLDPSYLELSPQCQDFVDRYGPEGPDQLQVEDAYDAFTNRFGILSLHDPS